MPGRIAAAKRAGRGTGPRVSGLSVLGGKHGADLNLAVRFDAVGVSREWGIMPRWPTARSGWYAGETGGPILSRAFHCNRAANLKQEIGTS